MEAEYRSKFTLYGLSVLMCHQSIIIALLKLCSEKGTPYITLGGEEGDIVCLFRENLPFKNNLNM